MLSEYSVQFDKTFGHKDPVGPLGVPGFAGPCGGDGYAAIFPNRKQRRAEAAITRSKRKGVKR